MSKKNEGLKTKKLLLCKIREEVFGRNKMYLTKVSGIVFETLIMLWTVNY